MGLIDNELSSFQDSMDHFSKSVFYCERVGAYPSWINWLKAGVLRAKAKIGSSKIDLDALYEYKNSKIPYFDGWISRYIGEIFLNTDDLQVSEAEKWIKKAIVADEKNNMRINLGKDYKLFSDILNRKGDKLQARECLIKAIEIFRECGTEERAKKAEKELSAS
jgi:tetratricopeptide (TPR) repeat protein